MKVIKSDGKKQKFDKKKIIKSCMRVGASKKVCMEMLDIILPECYDNISTEELRMLIIKELSRKKEESARRYRNFKGKK